MLVAMFATIAAAAALSGCQTADQSSPANQRGQAIFGPKIPRSIPRIPLPPPLPVPLPPIAVVSPETLATVVECNGLQFRQAWWPRMSDALRGLGATASERAEHADALARLTDETCSLRRYGAPAAAALARIDRVNRAIDERLADDMSVSIERAALFREHALAWHLRELANPCFSSREARAPSALARFPQTPSIPGLTAGQPITPIETSFGTCPTLPTAGGGQSLGAMGRSLSECLADMADAHEDCESPVGDGIDSLVESLDDEPDVQDAVASAKRALEEKEWEPCENGSGQCRSINYRHTSDDGDYHVAITQRRNDEGRTTTQTMAFEHDGDRPGGYGSVVLNAVESPTRTVVQTPTTPSQVFWGIVLAPVRLLKAVWGSLDCVPFDAAGGAFGGLGRGIAGPSGAINGLDPIAYCACEMGGVGPQLANAMGFGCYNPGWSERVRCLVNPHDPVGGIRPECVEHVREDYGPSAMEQLDLWCDATIQCPATSPGARAVGSVEGAVSCACDPAAPGTGGGGGRPAPPGCGPAEQPVDPDQCVPDLPLPDVPKPLPGPGPFPGPSPTPWPGPGPRLPGGGPGFPGLP